MFCSLKDYDICRDSFSKPAKSSDNPFSRFRQQLSDIINYCSNYCQMLGRIVPIKYKINNTSRTC